MTNIGSLFWYFQKLLFQICIFKYYKLLQTQRHSIIYKLEFLLLETQTLEEPKSSVFEDICIWILLDLQLFYKMICLQNCLNVKLYTIVINYLNCPNYRPWTKSKVFHAEFLHLIWPNPQFQAHLVLCTEDIPNKKYFEQCLDLKLKRNATFYTKKYPTP